MASSDVTLAARLAHPPAGEGVQLERLGERHRAALKAACAEDQAIWEIYPFSWAPDRFDAQFDAALGNPGRIMFAILDHDRLAGMTAYIAPHETRGIVEIGNTYFRPAARGTGLNRRLKALMIGHAFACGVRRIEFRIDERNARSKAAVVKVGGVFEGVMRAERITWTGHVRDTALFSILAGNGRHDSDRGTVAGGVRGAWCPLGPHARCGRARHGLRSR